MTAVRGRLAVIAPNVTMAFEERIRLLEHRMKDRCRDSSSCRRRGLFGLATSSDVARVEHRLREASKQVQVLYNNQQELASVLNLTRLQTVHNFNDLQSLHEAYNGLADRQQKQFMHQYALEVMTQLMMSFSQVELIMDTIDDSWRRFRLMHDALRNGHLSEFVFSKGLFQSVLNQFPAIGQPMPIEWYRAYADISTVRVLKGTIVAVCDLWIRRPEHYTSWTLRSYWTPFDDIFARLQVQPQLLIDDMHANYMHPDNCVGCNPILCSVSKETNPCKQALFDGHVPPCSREWVRSISSHIDRLRDNAYVVQPNRSITLDVQCSTGYPMPFTFSVPTLFELSEACYVTWPGGRSLPVVHKSGNYSVTHFLPY